MGLVRDLNQRRFHRGPLASSTGHDWLHALAGCCPSPVIGKAVFARFVGGATSNGLHAEAIVHMLTRSDTLVFSGSQTCGILLFRTRAESSFGEQKVKHSDRLELDWLLKCKLEELIASVRPMSAKNCEQIVRAILDRIGGPSFEQLLMRIVETMVLRDGRGPPTNSDEYYFAIRDLFPWADFYVSLCECACCGLKRIPIQPRIEQDIFMLSERDDTHSKKPSPLQFAARIQM